MSGASPGSRQGGLALAAFLALASGCGFRDPAPIVPSYTCNAEGQCGVAHCIEGVCASESASGYTLMLRVVLPPTTTVPGLRSFTFDEFELLASEERDLVLPAPQAAYGSVGFGTLAVPASVSFTRKLPAAGDFVDDVRALAPSAVVSGDGMPADYRVDLAQGATYVAVAAPSSASTPAAVGIPSALVGKPLNEVFPPIVATVDVPFASATGASRVDFRYDAALFSPCTVGTATSCTATGRLVSVDAGGGTVPEADLSVVLVTNDTAQESSTRALTAADGSFELRVSRGAGPLHLRVGPTTARPGFETIELDPLVYDPAVGGDVVVPRAAVVRFVGRVEYQNAPVAGALVRAIARTVRDVDDVPIDGASFENVVRTTSSSATVGPGYFALDLLEGDYDLVVSDATTQSSMVRTNVTVKAPPGGGSLQGQVFALGAIPRMAGLVAGPGSERLAYAQLQAVPYVPRSRVGMTEAFARAAATSSDEAGNFGLSADPGFYDLIVSVPAAEGLADAVVPGLTIASDRPPPWFAVQIPFAAVLHGRALDGGGMPIPAARVEAYVVLPETLDSAERVVALGSVVAASDGSYRLLVPSALGSPP